MKRRQVLACVSAALLILAVLVGCDNTFRPVVNPVPQPGGVPQQLKLVFVLSNAGTNNYGVLSALDVSGDTNIGEIALGHGPLSFALATGGQTVYVANQTDSSISTIGGFIPNTSTPLTLTQSVSNLPAGILCQAPPCAAGNPMVATLNNLYITQPDYLSPSGQGAVAIASLASGVNFTGQILIGAPTKNSVPTQLISVPVLNKVYSVNTNTNDLTSWNAQSNSITTASIAVGNSPVQAVANVAGTRVFVANQTDGTVSVIDTSNDEVINSGTDATPKPAIAVGTQPVAVFLDDPVNELFVANKGSNSISIVNVAVPQPTPGQNPNANPNPEFGQVTTVNIPGPGVPVGVVATPDGTRAFCLTVDSHQNPYVFEIGLIGNATPTVSQVLPSPPSLTPTPTPVPSPTPYPAPQAPTSFQFGISTDGTKVYLVYGANSQQTYQRLSGSTPIDYLAPWPNVYVISTQNDAITNTVNSVAPLSVPQQSNASPVQIVVQP